MKKILTDASLLTHNTFGMDVHAAVLAEYDTLTDLRELLHDPTIRQLMQTQREKGDLPFWHIGSGSNLLFEGDYPGVVLHSTAQGIRIVPLPESETGSANECLLEVDAGTPWDEVCAYCARHELYGPENLSLIPGETGAAAVQNIGAYGIEISQLIHQVVCYDIETDSEHIFTASDMAYGYRESRLKHRPDKDRFVVTLVRLMVQRHGQLHLEYTGIKRALGISEGQLDAQTKDLKPDDIRQAVIRIRQGKLPDPAELGNAGSFFKNPIVPNSVFAPLFEQYPEMPHYVVDSDHTKIPAGWLIEQCGWKGRSLGRAGVYERQSLVLVNRGGATPDEIVRLCRTIVADVEARFGIRIEPEVNIISGK